MATRLYGTCQGCGKGHRVLDARGVIRSHANAWASHDRNVYRVICHGTHKLPLEVALYEESKKPLSVERKL